MSRRGIRAEGHEKVRELMVRTTVVRTWSAEFFEMFVDSFTRATNDLHIGEEFRQGKAGSVDDDVGRDFTSGGFNAVGGDGDTGFGFEEVNVRTVEGDEVAGIHDSTLEGKSESRSRYTGLSLLCRNIGSLG